MTSAERMLIMLPDPSGALGAGDRQIVSQVLREVWGRPHQRARGVVQSGGCDVSILAAWDQCPELGSVRGQARAAYCRAAYRPGTSRDQIDPLDVPLLGRNRGYWYRCF